VGANFNRSATEATGSNPSAAAEARPRGGGLHPVGDGAAGHRSGVRRARLGPCQGRLRPLSDGAAGTGPGALTPWPAGRRCGAGPGSTAHRRPALDGPRRSRGEPARSVPRSSGQCQSIAGAAHTAHGRASSCPAASFLSFALDLASGVLPGKPCRFPALPHTSPGTLRSRVCRCGNRFGSPDVQHQPPGTLSSLPCDCRPEDLRLPSARRRPDGVVLLPAPIKAMRVRGGCCIAWHGGMGRPGPLLPGWHHRSCWRSYQCVPRSEHCRGRGDPDQRSPTRHAPNGPWSAVEPDSTKRLS
jgi:hypothetical protein